MGQRNFKPKHSFSSGRSFNHRKSWLVLYDTTWEKYRLKFLGVNKICYSCGEIATVVDHLEPHQGDKTLFEKLDNHIPLCRKCHDTVTAKFDRNWSRGKSITPKISWFSKNRMVKGLTFRIKVLPTYEER